jgi:hypothetical protein
MNSFNAKVAGVAVELNPAIGLAMPMSKPKSGANPVQLMVNVVVPGVITAPPFSMNGTSTVGEPCSWFDSVGCPVLANVQLAVCVLAAAGDEVDSTLIAVAPASIPVPSAMVATACTNRRDAALCLSLNMTLLHLPARASGANRPTQHPSDIHRGYSSAI